MSLAISLNDLRGLSQTETLNVRPAADFFRSLNRAATTARPALKTAAELLTLAGLMTGLFTLFAGLSVM